MEYAVAVNGSYMTNTYVGFSKDCSQCFIVDPASPLPQLVSFFEENKLTPEYIILTHGHGDHTGGIDFLKEKYPEIKLLASKKEKDFLYNRKISFGQGGIVPDIFVKDEETLTVGTMELKFLSTPGHTPGGMCILCDGVLFSGDTLFHTSVGRTDFEGGNTEQLMTSIKEKLLPLPDETIVLPGHDTKTTIGYERKYNPFL